MNRLRLWAAERVVRYKWWLLGVSVGIGIGYVVALVFFLPAVTADQLGVFIAVQGVLLLLLQCADMIESDRDAVAAEAVERVLQLCEEWDTYCKGESPTTGSIRRAVEGERERP